jgi:hypothetical protein
MPRQETGAETLGICCLRKGFGGRRFVGWTVRELRRSERRWSLLPARYGLAGSDYSRCARCQISLGLTTGYFLHPPRVLGSLTFITSPETRETWRWFSVGIRSRNLMDHRHKPRLTIALPVRVWGVDANSRPFMQLATIRDMSDTGILIGGLTCSLRPGTVVDIQYDSIRAEFLVTRVSAGEVALQRLATHPSPLGWPLRPGERYRGKRIVQLGSAPCRNFGSRHLLEEQRFVRHTPRNAIAATLASVIYFGGSRTPQG